jgi:hypothetical protein
MRVNGFVYKIDDNLHLSLIEPVTEKCTDGIPLINNGTYDPLEPNQIVFAEIIVQDGTKEIEDINVFEFVSMVREANVYFYAIRNIMVYAYPETIKDVCEWGEFDALTSGIIEKEKIRDKNG